MDIKWLNFFLAFLAFCYSWAVEGAWTPRFISKRIYTPHGSNLFINIQTLQHISKETRVLFSCLELKEKFKFFEAKHFIFFFHKKDTFQFDFIDQEAKLFLNSDCWYVNQQGKVSRITKCLKMWIAFKEKSPIEIKTGNHQLSRLAWRMTVNSNRWNSTSWGIQGHASSPTETPSIKTNRSLV